MHPLHIFLGPAKRTQKHIEDAQRNEKVFGWEGLCSLSQELALSGMLRPKHSFGWTENSHPFPQRGNVVFNCDTLNHLFPAGKLGKAVNLGDSEVP